MTTQITVSPQIKPASNFGAIFNNTNLRNTVFQCLTIADQDKTKGSSKGWRDCVFAAQRALIKRDFPEDQLKLVGGNLDSLPIRNIPLVQHMPVVGRGKLTAIPNLAIGWVEIEYKVWTVHIFKRESTQDRTALNTLIYYFSLLPDTCEYDWGYETRGESGEEYQVPVKTIPAEVNLDQEAVKPKIGFWDVETRTCSYEAPCCCCDTCCSCCRPWNLFLRIFSCCNNTQTLSVERDAGEIRRNTHQHIVSTGQKGQIKRIPLLGYQGAHYFSFKTQVEFRRLDSETSVDPLRIRYANLRDERPALPAPAKQDEVEQGNDL